MTSPNTTLAQTQHEQIVSVHMFGIAIALLKYYIPRMVALGIMEAEVARRAGFGHYLQDVDDFSPCTLTDEELRKQVKDVETIESLLDHLQPAWREAIPESLEMVS